MSTITREFLSQSTNGAFVNITASGTPGTLVHTATNTAGQKDEVWLWAVNNTPLTASVAIEWAGNNDVIDISKVGVPAVEGEQLLIAGRTLAGGLTVRIFSDHTNATVSGLNIGGHISRIDENG